MQLTGLEHLVEQAKPLEGQWRSLIPADIRPAAGHVNLVAFHSLMLSAHLRGSAWIRQFIFSFPLIGALIQRITFSLDHKQQVSPGLLQRGLFSSSRARIDERSAKAGCKNEKALWSEAKEQQHKGWLSDPFLLTFSSSSSSACAVGDRKLNIAFRFWS